MPALAPLLAALWVASADPAAAAWSARSSPGGWERAVEALDAASRGPGAGLPVFERLVRARFFVASERLAGRSKTASAAYRRCVEDGVRGLAGPGSVGPEPDLEVLARGPFPDGVGVLYWTTLCYGNVIPGMPLLKQAGAALRFRRLLERLVELDGSYFHAGPHRVLAEFLHKAPGIMGGDDDRARVHADRAVALAPGFAGNWLVRAEEVWAPRKDEALRLADLRAALALPKDGPPDAVDEHRIAQARARRLLTGR